MLALPGARVGQAPDTIKGVRRAEALAVRILGVLLILLGLTLFSSPRITYTTHERIPHSDYRVSRENAVLVPRPAASLIAGAGILALLFARAGHPSR